MRALRRQESHLRPRHDEGVFIPSGYLSGSLAQLPPRPGDPDAASGALQGVHHTLTC